MMLRLLLVLVLMLTTDAHEEKELTEEKKQVFELLSHKLDNALKVALGVASTTEIYPERSHVVPIPSGDEYSKKVSASSHPVSPPSGIKTEGSLKDKFRKHKYPKQIGSIRGIPGVDFPDYADIPVTSFTCSDKPFIPGFYADMDTGCQVFHVCWPYRRESFLCPVGTTFNQALLACDYWYSTNCSLSTRYYGVNVEPIHGHGSVSKKDEKLPSMIKALFDTESVEQWAAKSQDSSEKLSHTPDSILSFISQFLPVKTKVFVYPETGSTLPKIAGSASVGSNTQKEELYGHKHDHHHPHPGKPVVPKEKHDDHPKKSEVLEQENIFGREVPPETRPSTKSPKTVKSKAQYIKVDETVRIIIEEVFDAVKSIIHEAKALLPMLDAAHKVHDHSFKHIPLTKLNPRFITKPVMPKAVYEKDIPLVGSKIETMKASIHPLTTGHSKKSVVKKTFHHDGLNVSPLTKKALTESYIRLLKLKKA